MSGGHQRLAARRILLTPAPTALQGGKAAAEALKHAELAGPGPEPSEQAALGPAPAAAEQLVFGPALPPELQQAEPQQAALAGPALEPGADAEGAAAAAPEIMKRELASYGGRDGVCWMVCLAAVV